MFSNSKYNAGDLTTAAANSIQSSKLNNNSSSQHSYKVELIQPTKERCLPTIAITQQQSKLVETAAAAVVKQPEFRVRASSVPRHCSSTVPLITSKPISSQYPTTTAAATTAGAVLHQVISPLFSTTTQQPENEAKKRAAAAQRIEYYRHSQQQQQQSSLIRASRRASEKAAIFYGCELWDDKVLIESGINPLSKLENPLLKYIEKEKNRKQALLQRSSSTSRIPTTKEREPFCSGAHLPAEINAKLAIRKAAEFDKQRKIIEEAMLSRETEEEKKNAEVHKKFVAEQIDGLASGEHKPRNCQVPQGKYSQQPPSNMTKKEKAKLANRLAKLLNPTNWSVLKKKPKEEDVRKTLPPPELCKLKGGAGGGGTAAAAPTAEDLVRAGFEKADLDVRNGSSLFFFLKGTELSNMVECKICTKISRYNGTPCCNKTTTTTAAATTTTTTTTATATATATTTAPENSSTLNKTEAKKSAKTVGRPKKSFQFIGFQGKKNRIARENAAAVLADQPPPPSTTTTDEQQQSSANNDRGGGKNKNKTRHPLLMPPGGAAPTAATAAEAVTITTTPISSRRGGSGRKRRTSLYRSPSPISLSSIRQRLPSSNEEEKEEEKEEENQKIISSQSSLTTKISRLAVASTNQQSQEEIVATTAAANNYNITQAIPENDAIFQTPPSHTPNSRRESRCLSSSQPRSLRSGGNDNQSSAASTPSIRSSHDYVYKMSCRSDIENGSSQSSNGSSQFSNGSSQFSNGSSQSSSSSSDNNNNNNNNNGERPKINYKTEELEWQLKELYNQESVAAYVEEVQKIKAGRDYEKYQKTDAQLATVLEQHRYRTNALSRVQNLSQSSPSSSTTQQQNAEAETTTSHHQIIVEENDDSNDDNEQTQQFAANDCLNAEVIVHQQIRVQEKQHYNLQCEVIRNVIQFRHQNGNIVAKKGQGLWDGLVKPLFEDLVAAEKKNIYCCRREAPFQLFNKVMRSCATRTQLMELVLGEIGRLNHNLRRQITKKLIGYKERLADHNALLQLGRLRYHLLQQGQAKTRQVQDDLTGRVVEEQLFWPIQEIFGTKIFFPWLVDEGRICSRRRGGDDDDGRSTTTTTDILEKAMNKINKERRLEREMGLEWNATRAGPEMVSTFPTFEAEEASSPKQQQQDSTEDNHLTTPQEHMSEVIADEVGEIHGDDVIDDFLAGDRADLAIAVAATYIQPCSENCESSLKFDELKKEALFVKKELLKVLELKSYRSATLKAYADLMAIKRPELGDKEVYNWLVHYSCCWQGLRSVVRRLDEMLYLCCFMERAEELDKEPNWEKMEKVLSMEYLPNRLILAFEHRCANMGGRPADSEHQQAKVYQKFGNYIENFENDLKEQKLLGCQCCEQLTYPKNMHYFGPKNKQLKRIKRFLPTNDTQPEYINPAAVNPEVRPPVLGFWDPLTESTNLSYQRSRELGIAEEEIEPPANDPALSKEEKSFYGICNLCWRQIRENLLPTRAVKNGLGYPQVPNCLTGLNWLELALIQRIRPVMKILVLQTNSGKKKGMLATSGPMVMVPLSIQKTVDHVAQTLPNTNNLLLHVRTSFGSETAVNLPKVLHALAWLKANNPAYKDININGAFQFKAGDEVTFEEVNIDKDEATRQLIESRTAEGGPQHMLTQDHHQQQQQLKETVFRDVVTTEMDSENTAANRYFLNKIRGELMSVDTQNADVMIFPYLHPDGTFGISHNRKKKVTLTYYGKCRLAQRNRTWAQNYSWLMWYYQLHLQLDMTSTLGVQSRGLFGLGINGLRDALKDPTFLTKNLTSIFGKQRNSPGFWQKVRLDLRSHIMTFGAPTWFVTFNPAVRSWRALHRHYNRVLGLPPGTVNDRTIMHYINKDPSIFSFHWKKRIDSIFQQLLAVGKGPRRVIAPIDKRMKEDGEEVEYSLEGADERPFSVQHFFARTEWQARGLQHTHCLLWSGNAPGRNATVKTVTDYLSRNVTARMPSKHKEPVLYDLVKKHQMHWPRHNKTCLRKRKFGGKWMSYCRFGFPRPQLANNIVTAESNIRTAAANRRKPKAAANTPGAIRHAASLKQLKKMMPTLRNRPYHLARNSNEVMVNDYSPVLLLGTKANVDCQLVVQVMDVLSYVTSYATKDGWERAREFGEEQKDADIDGNEEEEEDEAVTAVKNARKDGPGDEEVEKLINDRHNGNGTRADQGDREILNKMIFKEYLNIMNMKETGLGEQVDFVMGHPLYQFDCDHVFIDLGAAKERRRLLKPITVNNRKEKKKINDPAATDAQQQRQERVYVTNWLDDYYRLRPQRLEESSLFNLMINFEVISNKRGGGSGRRVITAVDDDDNDNEVEEEEENAEDGEESNDGSGEEELEEPKRQPNRGPKVGHTAQTINPYEGHYHIYTEKSPFFEHPDILIGERLEFLPLASAAAKQEEEEVISSKRFRKKKARVGRVYLPVWFTKLDAKLKPVEEDSNFTKENATTATTPAADSNCQAAAEKEVIMTEEQIQARNRAILRNDFFRRLCLLFIPWRKEETLIEDYVNGLLAGAENDDDDDELREEITAAGSSYEKCFALFLNQLDKNDEEGGCKEAFFDIEKWVNAICWQAETDARHAAHLKELKEAQRLADVQMKKGATAATTEHQSHVDKDVAVLVTPDGLTIEGGHEGAAAEAMGRRTDNEDYSRKIDSISIFQRRQILKKNPIQEKVFNEIMEHIEVQSVARRQHLQNPQQSEVETPAQAAIAARQPLRLFLSGLPGTGKSFLISLLADTLTQEYCQELPAEELLPPQLIYKSPEEKREAANKMKKLRPAVLLAAQTGLAALNIGGKTIHSLLAIPVETDLGQDLLSDIVKQRKRALFSNVRLLIIDEISMCSSTLLWQVNVHLQAIMGNREPFGGMNFLATGDLLQLPPIRAPQVFEPPSLETIRTRVRHSSVSNKPIFEAGLNQQLNLWSLFDYNELTQNMRQSDDRIFADMLKRMRVGRLTDADKELLESRVIKPPPSAASDGREIATELECVSAFLEIWKTTDKRALIVVPTLKQADNLNLLAMNMIISERTSSSNDDTNGAIVQIVANDRLTHGPEVDARRGHGGPQADLAGEGTAIAINWDQEVRDVRRRPYQEKIYRIDDEADYEESRRRQARQNPNSKSKVGLNEDEHGLRLNLFLAEGCRIILRQNLQNGPISGLVNGALGTLVKILKRRDYFTAMNLPVPAGLRNADLEVIEGLVIAFDSEPDVNVLIRRTEVSYKLNRGRGKENVERRKRRQFPVQPAFAVTIHKVQGQTLDTVFVSTMDMFAPGQFVVACSRCKTLDGLHLMDLETAKLLVDEKGIREQNRLRRLHPEYDLPQIKKPPPPPKRERQQKQQQQPQKKSLLATDDLERNADSLLAKVVVPPAVTLATVLDNITNDEPIVFPSAAGEKSSSNSSNEDEIIYHRRRPSTKSKKRTTTTTAITATVSRKSDNDNLIQQEQQQEKKKNTRHFIKIQMAPPLLHDQSTNQTSWLGSSLNLVNQIMPIRKKFISYIDSQLVKDAPLAHIGAFLNGDHCEIKRIQQSLSTILGLKNFDQSMRPAEVLQQILCNMLAEKSARSIRFQESQLEICVKCSTPVNDDAANQPEVAARSKAIFRLNMDEGIVGSWTDEDGDPIKIRLEDAMQAQLDRHLVDSNDDGGKRPRCQTCGAGSSIEYQRRIVEGVEERDREYLLVEPIWPATRRVSSRPHLLGHDLRDGNELFKGQRYLFVGLIEKTMNNSGNIKYVTWLRNPGTDDQRWKEKYIVIEGKKVTEEAQIAPQLYNRAVIMLFKKKIFVREPRRRIIDPVTGRQKIVNTPQIRTAPVEIQDEMSKAVIPYEQSSSSAGESENELMEEASNKWRLSPNIPSTNKQLSPTASTTAIAVPRPRPLPPPQQQEQEQKQQQQQQKEERIPAVIVDPRYPGVEMVNFLPKSRPDRGLRLKNVSGSDCFLIGPTYLLSAVEPLYNRLLNYDEKKENVYFDSSSKKRMVKELKSIFEAPTTTTNSVVGLRQLLPPNFHHRAGIPGYNNQHDAAEVMSILGPALDTNLMKDNELMVKEKAKCSKCQAENELERSHGWGINIPIANNSKLPVAEAIREVVEEQSLLRQQNCNRCGNDLINEKIDYEYSFTQSTRYFWTATPGARTIAEGPTFIDVAPFGLCKMFDVLWRPIGLVCFHPAGHANAYGGVGAGHYTTWLFGKEGNSRYHKAAHLNDDRFTSEVPPKRVRLMVSAKIILYERVQTTSPSVS